jgi:hypothetical protein
MSGTWLGKDYSGLGYILDFYDLSKEDKIDVFEYLHFVVTESSKLYEERRKVQTRTLESQGRNR